MSNVADREPRRARFPLAWKLSVALVAGVLAMLAALVLLVGPHTTRAFLASADALVARGADEMRRLARADAGQSRDILLEVIEHTTDARRRDLADLPLSLYVGDPARLREAVLDQDSARGARLRGNADLLGREMEQRAMARIDEQVARISAEQADMGRRFASDLRTSYLALAGGVLGVFVILLGFGTWRVVVRPIRELRRATRAVTVGDYDVHVDAGRNDEVGALAADFAEMVRQLRESREELQRWNETLESEVARKTEHLESALDDLRRAQRQLVHAAKMASLGTLAGGVAHEFNNVIGGIRGCAAEALADETDEDRREPLEVILRAANRGAAVTEQLLSFARRRIGAMEPVSVGEILDEATRLVEPQARRHDVALSLRRDGDLECVADAGALHQVFLNLLTNALQAMPRGGRLDVAAERRADAVVVRVSDTGVGIPPERIEQVFDPFFTSRDGADDGARVGTGLGLSVSYGLVEAHDGRIEVESEVGRGTTFTVTLPVGGPKRGGPGRD